MLETKANTETNPQFPFPVEQEEPREETNSAEVLDESIQEPTNTTELRAQGHRSVKEIANAIISRKGTIVQSFLGIGNLLIEAKEQLTKHGQWMKWLDIEVNISYRMAERYMQLGRTYANSTSVSNLGMTKALALLALPESQRESFISEPHEVNGQQKTVSDMSVREIRRAIHEKMVSAKTDNITAKEADESSSKLKTVFWTISQATLFVVGPVVPIQPRSWPWAWRETKAPAARPVMSTGRPSGSVSSCFPVRT